MKVVLAGKYPARTFETLRELLPESQFELEAVDTPEAYDAMTDAEIMILRIFKAPAEVIERNKNLKMILRWGAGYDSVDIQAAGERGILVTNTPGANAGAVAELAVMLMLAVGRKLLCHHESLRQGEWSKNTFLNSSYSLNNKIVGIIGAGNHESLRQGEWSKNTFLNSSYSLNNKIVGIIGAGNIGRQVAKRVQAFGAKTQYYDEFKLTPAMETEFSLPYVTFEELIKTSDIITLHIPLTDQTKHIIGAKELERMKPGAIVINTARGGLVDDCALAAAVRDGRLRGAGLDGVEREPLSPDDELLQDPNIIVTPHVGGGTADIGDVILPMLAQDIRDFADGNDVKHVVNREYLSGK